MAIPEEMIDELVESDLELIADGLRMENGGIQLNLIINNFV